MAGVIHPDANQPYLGKNNPEARLIRPFLGAGFDVTWTRKITTHGSVLPFFFLKPSDELVEAYGFEYEVLLVYSPFNTLEPRTFQAVDRFMNSSPARGRVEAMFFFLVSRDSSVAESTTRYLLEHKEERIAIPLCFGDLADPQATPWTVRNAIQRHYLTLDRFRYTLPLQEDTYFFGRQREIGYLLDACKRGENAGLFGLRKTGKTSLLFKLQRTVEREGFALCLYIDCQSTSIRLRRWNDLLAYIATHLAEKVHMKLGGSFTPADAADAISRIFDDVVGARHINRVVLIFDEVEWISPSTAKDRHWDDDFVAFWHALRTHQTRKRNLSVLVAGVNPFIVEADLIGGYQNPLFGIVSPTYLAGFERGECDDMVVKIGKVMGLRFTQEALAYLYDQYGGHPLLTRLACSLTREFAKAEGKSLPLVITDTALKRAASPRDTELRFYCRHIVSELERFYPEEYRLLELLATGAYNEFLEQVRTASYAVHLYKYGALSNPDSPFISYGVLQDYVAEENARREGRSTPYRVVLLDAREEFVQVRIHSIIEDMRTLESLARQASLPSLFGPNSFPEADRLLTIRAPTDASSLAAALTPLQRSFVESIENYGRSVESKSYFWSSIKQHYPHLHEALHRVRIYRNEHQHLILTTGVGAILKQFLEVDLPGDMIHSPDKFWILFQRTLDELQRALQREIAGLRD